MNYIHLMSQLAKSGKSQYIKLLPGLVERFFFVYSVQDHRRTIPALLEKSPAKTSRDTRSFPPFKMARQNFIGLVVSQGKMSKTVKVQVDRKTFNRIINKEIIKRTNYLVHDEGNIAREGDIVRIEACRPLSAKKHFAIAEIRKNKGSQFAQYDQVAKQQVLLEENEKAQEFLDRRSRTEADIENNTSLISDLSFISKGAHTPEGELSSDDAKKIAQLKEKYGIKSWPPQREVLELEIQSLRQQVQAMQDTINFVDPVLAKLMEAEYETRVDAVLQDISKKEPQELKKNVKKNLLRKFLLKNPQLAREKFGDVVEQVKLQ